MAPGHERLDVYRLSISYVAWVYEKTATLEGVHRAARDQWLRASQSIPLNMAESNGKTGDADRRRCFEIARRSVLECAAIQAVRVVGKALDEAESRNRKTYSTAWQRCGVDWAEEETRCETKRRRTTGAKAIPIPIAIWMKTSPNHRLLRTGYRPPQSRDDG